MTGIVQGLFGLSAQDVSDQQLAEQQARNLALARMPAGERAAYAFQNVGSGIGQAVAGMMGYEDPKVTAAKKREQLLVGLDENNPDTFMQAAQRAQQSGEYGLAAQLVDAKRQLEATRADIGYKQAQATKLNAEANKPVMPVAPKIDTFNDRGYEVTVQFDPTRDQYVEIARNKLKTTDDGTGRPSAGLNRDQQWVRKDGTWVAEIIPGTKTFQAQKDLYAKDKAVRDTIVDRYATSKEKVDYILSPANASKFNNLFGGYTEAIIGQRLSGRTADIKQRLESLKSEMKNTGLQIMKSGGGIGAITVSEWGIMEKMVDSLDPTMTEDTAREVISQILARMEGVRNRANEKFDAEWRGSQFDTSSTAPTTSPSPTAGWAIKKR